MAKTNRPIALVLGGGGARGLAHIGVLRWLEERSAPLDAIVGTSIGALIGGLYAAGTGVAEMEAVLRKTDKLAVARIIRPGFSASGLIDNERVRKFLKTFIGESRIEELPIPFRAVATDLSSGQEIVIDKGSLAEAILASIAIPALFMPVYHEGRYLVDGGLSNPLPVSVVQKISSSPCLAVNVAPNPECFGRFGREDSRRKGGPLAKMTPAWLSEILTERRGRPALAAGKNAAARPRKASFHSPTLLQVVLQSVSISTYNLIAAGLLNSKPRVLLSPMVEEFGILEFHEGVEIMRRGYDAAERSRSAIKVILASV
jgi:NTE family protein